MYFTHFDKTLFEQHINNLPKDQSLVISLAENEKGSIPAIQACLKENDRNAIGAFFPMLIVGNTKQEKGFIINNYISQIKGQFIKSADEIPGLFDKLDDSYQSMLVFCDGLSGKVDFLIKELYNQFGHLVKMLGAGAGSLSLQQEECLFTPDTIEQDAIIVLPIKESIGLGVQHGWKKIAGPFIATKTNGNIIEELNWENPFDIYKQQIKETANTDISADAFFDVSKNFPFGIRREGNEYVVRDPISVNDSGHLICVGVVPDNTALDLLQGIPQNLIDSAGQAAKDAIEKVSTKTILDCFVIDCISRVLFLEDDFSKELQSFQSQLIEKGQDINVEGVLSLGEIASDETGSVQFYNKTFVAGIFYE